MAGISVSLLERLSLGNKRGTVVQITGPTSYPTGGEALTAAQLGLHSVARVEVEPPIDSTPAARIATYDHTNSVIYFFTAGATQVANGTDLSTFSARATCIGV